MMRSPFFNDLVTLRSSIDRLADETFGGDPWRSLWSRSAGSGTVGQAMPLDVYATDEEVVILAAVPGMQPDDLGLTVHQNTVTLSGTIGNVAETDDAKDATWYLHELGSGSYRRSLTLPFPVDADKAEASFEHGMLRVTLPKVEAAKPRKISIAGGRQHEAIESGEGAER
jgi:HSP20 family protein